VSLVIWPLVSLVRSTATENVIAGAWIGTMMKVKNRVESDMIGAGQELQLSYMYCLPRIESLELCFFYLSECCLVISLRVLKLGRIGDGVVKGLSTDHPSFFSGTLVTSVHLSSPVPCLQVAKIACMSCIFGIE